MPLTLHYHPLSSYCQKVLIALDERGLAFDGQLLDLGNDAARAAFIALWPTGKMPLLVDDGQVVPETSIIIEHLERHTGRHSLLPADAQERLQARLWDRLFDLYVMTPMQALIADRLRPQAQRDPLGVEQALAALARAYAMVDRHMAGRAWAAGSSFSMADCAAAPALFYAATLSPFPAQLGHLGGYFERLVARPSVARVLAQARPFFQFYPAREGIAPRFLDPS